MWDIVYFVKDTPDNEELRYSLRSLFNFPHRKVCFYGGCPKGLNPDIHFEFKQDGRTKWENVKAIWTNDCKIVSKEKEWEGSDYLSTEDKAFADGVVGKQIRERFPDKCKYEL